jgi:hypothetical protein
MKVKLVSSLMVLTMLIAGCSIASVETPTDSQVSESTSTSTQATPPDQEPQTSDLDYVIVDSGQVYCYDDGGSIACPEEGARFSGQDAQYAGNLPRYVDNGGGTVTDLNTGLNRIPEAK